MLLSTATFAEVHTEVHAHAPGFLPYVAREYSKDELRRKVTTTEWRVHRCVSQHRHVASKLSCKRGLKEREERVRGPHTEELDHCGQTSGHVVTVYSSSEAKRLRIRKYPCAERYKDAWSCAYRCLQMLQPMSLQSMLQLTSGTHGELADLACVAQSFSLSYAWQGTIEDEETLCSIYKQIGTSVLQAPLLLASGVTCRLVVANSDHQSFVVLDPHLPRSHMRFSMSVRDLFPFGTQITVLQLETRARHNFPDRPPSSMQDVACQLCSHRVGAPKQDAQLYVSALRRLDQITFPMNLRLAKAQHKFLLRADFALQQRVVAATDDNQIISMIQAACQRVGIVPQPESTSTPSTDQLVGPRAKSVDANRQEQGDWKLVQRSRPRSNTPTKSDPPVRKLYHADWSVQPLQNLSLGQQAIYFPDSQEMAETYDKNLQGAKLATAILSLSPLHNAKSSELITFRVAQQRSGETTIREVVLSGYLNQYSQDRVGHLFHVPCLSIKTKSINTAVLLVDVVRSTISGREWHEIAKYRTTAEYKDYFKTFQLDLIDVWGVQATSCHLCFKVRIAADSVSEWLLAETPVIVTPTADSALGYKMIWSKDSQYLEEARDKFRGLRGYSGLAFSKGTLGT
eukprot:6462366-Amphidinium_carterae.1